MKKKLFFTVTNDLVFDQRMIRICTSLAGAGFEVTLVGRKNRDSPPLSKHPFRQRRLNTWFRRGKAFYLEYNLRLFFFLLFRNMDSLCAIDLDTIIPCYFVSRLRNILRLYDAHELFCEMQEVVSRPAVYKMWKTVERRFVPRFPHGYTVNGPIAAEFHRLYGVDYAVIRNMPLLETTDSPADSQEFSAAGPATGNPPADATSGATPPGRFILYQGAVNEGRCFETLIPAMQRVDVPLLICGDGNFMQQARRLVQQYGVQEKVIFKGMVRPEELKPITRKASIGITLFDRRGTSNYLSLANRFFDYMHAGVPQVAVGYPAYREINNSCPIAVLIDEPGILEIAEALNNLLNNTHLYQTLVNNSRQARLRYNWQEEEKNLILLYQRLFN
ncbi:MAG TPA: glycosyltransferase [Puia sp.]|jgi:glycosyltransferase involved in cell wall biosynthesis|nr:glycosyltransferase [Puia sp.]